MRLLIELSGEHPTLPRAEALAACEAEGVGIRGASWTSRLLLLDVDGPADGAMERLGLAHAVSEVVAAGDMEDVRGAARDLDLQGQAFRVRVRGLGIDVDVAGIEGAFGAMLGRTGKVRLTRPEVDFRLLVGETCYLGRVRHRVDRAALEARKPDRRTFAPPVSLHPKFARAVVNLSRVRRGGVVLDPFVGTGGILLEARRLGLRAVGGDLRASMALGARGALRALGVEADIVVADAGRLPWRARSVHGVATDPPYGRAASTRGEPLEALYERAFAAMADVLPRGGHAAVVLPGPRGIDVGASHLELVESHAVRVHRSLTRTFCAFRRR